MEKKANMLDYLAWRGDIALSESTFNPIDGMVLARFSYAPFQLAFLEDGSRYMTIEDATGKMLADKACGKLCLYQEDVELIEALHKSQRFNKLLMGDFVDIFKENEEVQFSAFSLRIDDTHMCVVYRGTDNTIVGWKEDLNMGFVSPLGCQILGKEYLEKIADQNPKVTFILCGHSKGGNVSAYAAAFCRRDIQERIRDVYNFDGPGFEDSVLESEGYERACTRIHTYVPQSSLVGMILGHREKHMIVHSMDQRVPYQHNMYTWEVLGKDFIYDETTTNASRYFDRTLKEFLGKMDKQHREVFVDTAYSLLGGTDAITVEDITSNFKDTSKIMLKTMKEMDVESRKNLAEGLRLFMKCAWKNFGIQIGQLPQKKQGV